LTESELVQRCRAGDRIAQRELYINTSERIYGLLLRMCNNADDAFDVAQNAYIRAFTRIGQFDGRSTLATWLYRIAVTEALQFLRRRKRANSFLKDMPTDSSIPCDEDRLDAAMDIHEALGSLDEVDRAMLLLRHREGLDYRTIAEIVECAEGTVASRLHRARDRLREKLGSGYEPVEVMRSTRHQ
jgi:RNA polymerase sigma-70 factor (ECF subfamily)